ncbi:uncharacterized protein [Drosophila takahashii]|uniref:uncharacterized protein n=1 Tax=Drosophila takahashii TaxID=29030 RepID=UPI0038990B2D
MAEHMSFLQGLSHKRKTFASKHAPSTSEIRGCDSPEEDTEEASYDYRPKKKKNNDPIGNEIEELLKSAKDLISVVQTKQDSNTTVSLKNVEMLSFWDKMMEDFSKEVLQQVQLDIRYPEELSQCKPLEEQKRVRIAEPDGTTTAAVGKYQLFCANQHFLSWR